MPHHDLVIVGSGSGNTVVTEDLEDLDIALVDEGTFGGTCLNVGCIPTKMFIVPADRVVEADAAGRLGVSVGAVEADWAAVRERIFGRIDPISAGGEAYRREQGSVSLYRTRARFTGDRRLRLDTGEELTADRVVVAVGGRPVTLPVDGLRQVDPDNGVHTSDTVMRMATLPRRMVVVGGGFVACEMAHVFSAFGVEVTVVQRSRRLLMREEESVSKRYTSTARRRHDLRLLTTVTAAERRGDSWHLTLAGPQGTEQVEAETVLLAVGRRPNSDLLDVAAGGVDTHPDGRVVTDPEQRTSAPGVWALGDVASADQLKHVANRQARIVAHNLAVDLGRAPGPPMRQDDRPVPHAVFGYPQVASFGPTSAELDAAGTDYASATQEVGDVAYGWALEDTTGFLTVHASPDGRVLAAHCIGPHASSIIQPLVQAASLGQSAHEVASGQYWIHPALSEVVENALLRLPA